MNARFCRGRRSASDGVLPARPHLAWKKAAVRVALSALAAVGGPSVAAADDFTLVADLPAGLACPTFGLRVEQAGGEHRVFRTFHDRFGSDVRVLQAGQGFDLRFTNLASNAQLTLKGNGSVSVTRPNPDGSSTVQATGHNVLILFPTDDPPGPTTRLYVGRVVYTVDASGTFTLLQTSGRQFDICAALGR